MSSTERPLGQVRGVGFILVMALVTLGGYVLYWIYKTYDELRRYRGKGVEPIVGLLLALPPVTIFLLPSYVGEMYKEDDRRAPISGWAGAWALIPLAGGIVWLARVQGTLNAYWEVKAAEARAPETPPEPSASAPASEGS